MTSSSAVAAGAPSRPVFRVGSLAVGCTVLAAVVWLSQHVRSAELHAVYLVATAFVITFFAVPGVHRLAVWRGIVDVPAARKIHTTPTPLLGGVAVFGGFAVTVLLNFSFSRPLKGVALGGAIVVAVGIADDVLDIPAAGKLLGQVAAALVALAHGVHLQLVPYWMPGAPAMNALVTVLWLLTVTNAIQFLDGMDGLATGLGAIAAVFFGVAALQTGQPYLTFLGAALAGACAGFLPYNFRPGGARIFLGDAGASFIGFALAGIAVMGEWSSSSPVVALFTPLLILAVPLFDIAFVSIERIARGKVSGVRDWLAYTGRDHIHHRFEALGLSRTQSVLLIHFITVTLGLSAIALKGAGREAVILAQAVCILAIIAILEGVGRGRPSR